MELKVVGAMSSTGTRANAKGETVPIEIYTYTLTLIMPKKNQASPLRVIIRSETELPIKEEDVYELKESKAQQRLKSP